MHSFTVCTVCTHLTKEQEGFIYSVYNEPKSKEVSFNMEGIFSCVRYYRKEIFVKGRGPGGLRILKEKY